MKTYTEKPKKSKKNQTPQEVRQKRMRFQWKLSDNALSIKNTTIQNKISQLFPKDLYKYDLNGSQSAETITPLGAYKTSQQKHSEMCAIEDMFNAKLWVLNADGKIVKRDGLDVPQEDFQTALPHCGFCTFFIKILGLPLTYPTNANFNQAVNLGYPLPQEVKKSAVVMKNAVGNYARIKELLNEIFSTLEGPWVLEIGHNYYNENGPVIPNQGNLILEWQEDIVNKTVDSVSVLDKLWSLVFSQLYSINKNTGEKVVPKVNKIIQKQTPSEKARKAPRHSAKKGSKKK